MPIIYGYAQGRSTPFLDIVGKLPVLNPFFDERGLLGLAFHPDYENNGRFFIRYSVPRAGDPSEPCFGSSRVCHSEVLAEYSVSAGDPNLADPTSEIVLFTVDGPQFNHDAGNVAFGPDGFLYFTLGDGGGAHDGLADSPPSHGPIGTGKISKPLWDLF
jgi:glucose/arabinose dehydrogenase